MFNLFKTGLLATAILGATALTLTAETVVVPLATTDTAVVGVTPGGDVVVKSTTYSVVTLPMTDAEMADFKSYMAATATGPYVGWAVTSADNMPLGTVSYSVQDTAGNITSFDLLMADGRGVRMTPAISKLGNKELSLRINQADLMANVNAPFTMMDVQ